MDLAGSHEIRKEDGAAPRNPTCPGSINLFFRIMDVEGKGRGLFATGNISHGDLIHEAPCLLVPRQNYKEHAKHTVLEHYLFNCKNGDRLLALGYGSIFNHSDPPNVDYRVDGEGLTVRYYAARDIKVEDELCIYYGANLWFEQTDGAGANDRAEESSDDEDFLSRIE